MIHSAGGAHSIVCKDGRLWMREGSQALMRSQMPVVTTMKHGC